MIIIHDFRVPSEYTLSLKERLPEATLIPFKVEAPSVYPSIAHHPDIYLFKLSEDTLIYSPGTSERFLEDLKEKGFNLIEGEEKPGRTYPETARYNAARIGDFVFHKTSLTDKVILEKAQEKGLTGVNIPQGYSRCSILSCGEDAIITSNEEIAIESKKRRIKTLLVSPGSILLPGQKHGFIGGSSGLASDGKVIILGDPSRHPDGDGIIAFLGENTEGFVFLEGLPLYDAGGLFIFGKVV